MSVGNRMSSVNARLMAATAHGVWRPGPLSSVDNVDNPPRKADSDADCSIYLTGLR